MIVLGRHIKMGEAKRILIVDDEPDIAGITGLRLRESGFRVINATNGLQALEAIFKEKPDLILLDLGLPDIGGAEVCLRIRQNEQFQNTPVIIFSAKQPGEMTEEERSLPVSGFIRKPCTPEELLQMIRNVLASLS